MAQHNYEGLKPTDTPSAVPTAIQASNDHPFNPWCAHNPMATQCNQSQYPNPNHNFALPQFMAQPNYEDLDPIDTPRAVSTALQASSDHTFNPKCAHDLMATQCHQSQHLTSLNNICVHNPSASQNNQISLSNSLASPYPPDLGDHALKKFATEVCEQGFYVKWFKFIYPSPKPRITETTVQKPVHVTYSPITSMNYQWTINVHDGYPPLQLLLLEEYIPPSLHNFCNFKPTMLHLGDDYLCPTKILPAHQDNGERLLAYVTIKEVEEIEKANRERYQNQSYNFGTGNGKLEKIISYSQHVDHQEPVTNEDNETNDDLYKLRALIGHQGPPKAPDPNLKRCKYNVHVEWETGEKTHEPLPVLATDDLVTCTSYTKGNAISHLNGWKRFKNLAKRDKPDISCITPPKGEIKSTFSWTSLSKTPTSSALCFGEPTPEKLNKGQVVV